MKRIILSITAFSILAFTTVAQTRMGYGLTNEGGTYGFGVIFSYNPFTNQDSVLFSFNNANGEGPYGSFLLASNNLLYGTTTYGGVNDEGVIFSFDPTTNHQTVLANFDSATTGSYPLGTLVEASNGLFYGTTYNGGTGNNGVLYSFDPNANKISILINFNIVNGQYPSGKLLQASNGKLYGMTMAGGSHHEGTLFSYDINTSQETVLVNFNDSNGCAPYGGLIEASAGKLYGMTYGGGPYHKGLMFSYNTLVNQEKVLFSFNGSNGACPVGNLTLGPNDMLYGLTLNGGDSNMGVAFSYNPAMGVENVMFSFDGSNGQNSFGSLVYDSITNKIFGMAHGGGNQGQGILFSINIGSNAENVLMNLSIQTGNFPTGDLVFLGSGLPTGLTQVVEENDVKLYPNPAHDYVNIEFNQAEKHYIGIYDMSGKELSMTDYNEQKTILPVSTLASGVYVIKVFDKDMKNISSSRLIIQ